MKKLLRFGFFPAIILFFLTFLVFYPMRESNAQGSPCKWMTFPCDSECNEPGTYEKYCVNLWGTGGTCTCGTIDDPCDNCDEQ